MKFASILLLGALACSVAAAPSPQKNGNNKFGNNRFGNNRFGNNRFGNNRFGNNKGGQKANNNGNKNNQGKVAAAPAATAGKAATAGVATAGAATAGAAVAGNAVAGNAAAGNAAAGNAAAAGGAAAGAKVNAQDSTTIDPKVLQTTDDGQNPPVDGQTAALVSKNNFANFCLLGLPQVPITNGLQVVTGSCNPIPIGNIPAREKMPSGKFQSPKNGDTVAADTPFTITMAVKNIQLGTFTNAQKTYFANPQTLNNQGVIIGHTHFVIESIPSLDSTAVTDPTKFVFFKGINGAANGQGQVSAEVPAPGLPAGTYRLGSIVTASTHQPAIVPIAQHGLLDDVVYFTATAGGAAVAGAATAGKAATAGAVATAGKAATAGAVATAGKAATAGKPVQQQQGGRRQ